MRRAPIATNDHSEAGGKRHFDADALWQVKRITGLTAGNEVLVASVSSLAPDGKRSQTQLYAMERDGSRSRALTHGEQSARAPQISPDGERLAFVRAPSGGGAPQLWVMNLAGGEAQQWTDFPYGIEGYRWMPDSAAFVVLSSVHPEAKDLSATRERMKELEDKDIDVYVSEDRIVRFWDHWIVESPIPHLFRVEAGESAPEMEHVRDLTPTLNSLWDPMGAGGQFDVHPRGTHVVYSANLPEVGRELARFGIYEVDLAGGETRALYENETQSAVQPRYADDGRAIVFAIDDDTKVGAKRPSLVTMPHQGGGAPEPWGAKAFIDPVDYQPFPSAATSQSASLVVAWAEEGAVRVGRILRGGAPEALTNKGVYSSVCVAPDGSLFGVGNSFTELPEIVAIGPTGAAVISGFNAELQAQTTWGESRPGVAKTADGTEVPYQLVLPPGYRDGQQVPLLQLLHGGPHWAWLDTQHPRWNAQVFAANGWAVVMANFRGSVSYGNDHAQALVGKWGPTVTNDVEGVTDHLIDLGIADPDQLVLAGGSFGGYLAAWLPTQTERYRAAVSHAPVVHFAGMWASDITDDLSVVFDGSPWAGHEAMRKHEPAAMMGRNRTPTLVSQGGKDYRVPDEQGLALYGWLKYLGVEARLVYYPSENHWILKPKASKHWYGEVISWLQRYLP